MVNLSSQVFWHLIAFQTRQKLYEMREKTGKVIIDIICISFLIEYFLVLTQKNKGKKDAVLQ